MKWLGEELPGFRHRLERHPPQRIGVHRNAPPANYPQALHVRSSFYSRPGISRRPARKERKTQPEHLRKLNSLLLRPRPKESLWYRGQQPCAVAAGAIRVDTPAVRQTLKRRQGMLNDVVIGRAAQARKKAGSARVIVPVPPIGLWAYSCLSNAEALLEQLSICIRQIEFCGCVVASKANRDLAPHTVTYRRLPTK